MSRGLSERAGGVELGAPQRPGRSCGLFHVRALRPDPTLAARACDGSAPLDPASSFRAGRHCNIPELRAAKVAICAQRRLLRYFSRAWHGAF